MDKGGGGINLEGVRLYGSTIKEATELRRVLWGEKMTLGDEVDKRWGEAQELYRDLRQWYQRTGYYDTAGRFHYRKWECKRKLAQQQKPVEILELWLYRLLSGYGERPAQGVLSGAVAVLLFTLLYMLPWASVDLSLAGLGTLVQRLGKALYFSGVSFTALGYGEWVEPPEGWIKHLGVVESFIGVFHIALFLVTFTRKISR